MESGQRPPLGDSLVIFELWAQAYRPSSVREKRPVLTTSSWLKSYFGLSVPPDIPKFETVSAFRFMLWGISIIDEICKSCRISMGLLEKKYAPFPLM